MEKPKNPRPPRRNYPLRSSSSIAVSAGTTALAPRNFNGGPNPYPTSPPIAESREELNNGLIEYWRILVRNKGRIFLGSFAGVALGFAVGIPMTPVFRAKTTLEVLSLNGDFMNQKQSNPTTTAVDNNSDTSEEQTQAKLLESDELLDRVISKLDPSAPKINADEPPPLAASGWRSWLHMRQPQARTRRQGLLDKAAASLKVKATARTRVLEVTLDSTDPKLAAQFANTLAQEYIAQSIEARWSTTQNTSEWLHRELEDARAKLRASEDALQSYASTSGLIFTDDTTNVATEKLQQLQQNLSAATADRIAKQSRFELAQNAPPDTLGDVLNDASLRDNLAKINDVRRQIADVNTIFLPGSDKVQRLQAEVDSLQAAFDRQRSVVVAHIQNDYIEADRKEKLLDAAYDAQAREVTGQDEKAIQYNILKRDVDSNRALYDTMLQQMKQASIASAIRAGNIRVVDPAKIPYSPVSPNFRINSAIGLFAGLFCSIVLVTLRDRADRTFRQPGDIKLWTEIIELGAIPNAALGSRNSNYRNLDGVAGKVLFGPERNVLNLPAAVELATAQKIPSMSAEAFRSTLTSLLFVSEEPDRPKAILFTSANATDGKTTVVSNLAIAAAEIRMNVLVVDADLRRPRIHSVFGLSNELGLVDILTGDIAERDVSDLIKATTVKNLSVITAGASTNAASHLLHSPMWGALLDKLRLEYDMILIDSPPMLQMTDARVAARKADAVVLIARSNLTTRDAVIAAKDRLIEDRIPILGAVLNDWDPKHSPGGYYGYYRSSYYRAGSYYKPSSS